MLATIGRVVSLIHKELIAQNGQYYQSHSNFDMNSKNQIEDMKEKMQVVFNFVSKAVTETERDVARNQNERFDRSANSLLTVSKSISQGSLKQQLARLKEYQETMREYYVQVM